MVKNLSMPAAVVVAGLLVAGAIFASNMEKPSDKGAIKINPEPSVQEFEVAKVTANEHIRGSLSSDIVAIEYSDTECPFCKNFHNTMKEVFEERGDFAWVYRHFPLSIHPKAFKEAVATECAADIGGNNAFWAYADRIFEVTPSNNGLNESELPKIAEFVGLDVSDFEKCLASMEFEEDVNEDMTSGEKAGVRGTPHTVILNQRTGETVVIAGAQAKEKVEAAIESLLDK